MADGRAGAEVHARLEAVEQKAMSLERAHAALSREQARHSKSSSEVASECQQNVRSCSDRIVELAKRVDSTECDCRAASSRAQQVAEIPQAVRALSDELAESIRVVRQEIGSLRADLSYMCREQERQASVIESLQRSLTEIQRNDDYTARSAREPPYKIGGDGEKSTMNDAAAADTENEGEAAHARATEQSENRQSALYERPLKPRTDGKTTAAKVETLAEQQRQVDILYQRLWNQQPRVSNQTKPC